MLALSALGGGAQAQRAPEPPAPIEVVTQPITDFATFDPARRRFGMLEFRGGLVLSSPSKHFGGISAIRVQPDGAQFIAL